MDLLAGRSGGLANMNPHKKRAVFRFGKIALITALTILTAGGSYYYFQGKGAATEIGEQAMPERVSFNFHIKPILSDRCFACHGPDQNHREAGLRLDLAEDAYRVLKDTPGVHGIVPGKPDLSGVYQRIVTDDPDKRMPPVASNLTLTPHEIKLIEKWIKQGAKYEKHWAFIPPRKVSPPPADDAGWATGSIDRFVWAKMQEKGLKPNPEADKATLLRRICTDITGLPPDLKQMEAFLADGSPDAYDKMVDQLLRSPHFGEKMALHWMDIARYADSYGYQDDQLRTQWPWRDWVIHAFNKNLSYDRFLTWQLAGDMLPGASMEQILATGFGRNHKITEEQGVIDEEYRVTYVLDRTNTYAKGILGITMECAQCHDHKYDPFSQKNYYELFAFFNNTPEKGIEIANSRESKPRKYPFLEISGAEASRLLKFVNMPDTSAVAVSVMEELPERRKTFVLNRGVYDAPGDEVAPSTPPSILEMNPDKYPRNRLGLAKWTVDPQNPLTSRVFVNQLWEQIFGRGLVSTIGDFGSQGSLPSHPELLDWLSVDFVQHGWNIKRLVKQIVTSATYRQSARQSPVQKERDPDNIYLSRANRIRLPAELIRDHVLASSGLLTDRVGGPSFKPYQPNGIWEVTSSGRGNLKRYVQDHGADLYRRGLYTFIKLTVPPPNMLIFDASNRDQCEVARIRTNTPLQALVMMNDPVILEASRVLAGRLLANGNQTDTDRITEAFRRILCRPPQEKEKELLLGYLESEAVRYGKSPALAEKFLNAGEYPAAPNTDKTRQAALMSVVHSLYNLEETITKN